VTRRAIEIAREIYNRKHAGHGVLAAINQEEILAGIQAGTLELSKRRYLREHQGKVPRRRDVLTDPGDRMRKFAVETGYDTRRGAFLAAPLEEWTCPDKNLGKLAYRDLMVWGKVFRIDDLDERDREIWTWALNEQLAAVDEHGVIVPLSDAASPSVRSYPGAPVPDQRAGIGRRLGVLAPALMLTSLANLSRGISVVRSRMRRKRGRITGDGIEVTAQALAAEANAIKARRPDLAEYRYLSLSTCRRLIRALIGAGVIDQVSPPKPMRVRRSWAMRARVLLRMTEVPEEFALPPG
jgi:hypothetical protein